ncbi:hypothetical protein PILCRDRAFT_90534 [Piloderma croceum F 1598]|uniref:DUF6532 domain-containing protein n=1 Tax=Piloderma croceum (strain F 1598) TaxID=765440 RepID=A0A0C3FEX8_PILCF|nr:hypothetical protein PILCRDRAFT_90534 [Piloderma croceum F 1598]
MKVNFPERREHLGGVAHCPVWAVGRHLTEGSKIKDCYCPEYKEMLILLYKEGSAFHDALKIKAQQVVADKYDLEPDWIGGFGQAEFYGYVSRRAQEYIKSFSFLHYGEDDQGRKNYFNHPALEALCIDFYYSSADSLGVLFPEEFRDSLPHKLLALAAAAKREICGLVPFLSNQPTRICVISCYI